MAIKVKANGGDPKKKNTVYKREVETVVKPKTDPKVEYKEELAFTKDKSYGKKSPEKQASVQKKAEGKDTDFQKSLRKAQSEKKDTFDYKGKPYKAGTTTVTPGEPEVKTKKAQVSLTSKREIASSKGDPKKGAELKSKGYKAIPGTYNYEKPEKQEWVDEDKAEDFKKSNPSYRTSDPEEGMRQAKAAKIKARLKGR